MARKQRKVSKRVHKLPRSILAVFPNLTDVTDARKNISVTVRDEDCTKGTKKSPALCAMARATQRQYHADGAVIGMCYSYIVQGDKATRYKTPVSVSKEIVSFDRHGDFATGEYELAAVSPSQRLGRLRRDRDHGSNHQPKRVVHRTTGVRVMEHGSK